MLHKNGHCPCCCHFPRGRHLVKMKFLVVLLLCLSAAVAIRLGYRPGRRYTYYYKGFIAHGIPEAFENDLAVRITAKVNLDYLHSGFVMLRVNDVTVVMVKGQVLDPDRILRSVKEARSLNEVKDRIKDCLEMPVKFQFKAKALEKEIFASKNDSEWCLNIKRAMINHFHLTINDNQKRYQTRKDEVTVAGKCDTAYAITSLHPYCNVKRVIDLTVCSYRPQYWKTNVPNIDQFISKKQCGGTAKQLPNVLKSAAYMDYKLQRDTDHGFLIRTVFSESEHDLTLLGDEYQSGKVVAARVRQKFTLLKKHQSVPTSAKDIKDEVKRKGLMFVYDDLSDVRKTEKAQKNIHAEAATCIAAIKEQLNSGNIEPVVAQTFTRLVSALRRCTKETLEKVARECIADKDPEFRKIFVDAVSLVGTKAAVKVIKILISEGKLGDHLARVAFGLGWIRYPNANVMKYIMYICQDENIAGKRQAKRICWLSFGNLVNRLMFHIKTTPRCTQDTKLLALRDIFAKTLREGVENAKDNEEKIIFIKAIGNAGWITVDVFKTVADHVTNPKLPLHVRVAAVWALRFMAKVEPIKVRRKILPIFADPYCDPELRIGCYKVLFDGDSSLVTTQMIASVIAREAAGRGPRSNQLVSFIASDLRTSINLDRVDCVRASRARLLLRFLPRNIVFGLFTYSKGVNIALNTGYKTAVEVRLHKINTPQTFIPRNLHTKIKLNIPGFSFNIFESGLRIQGLHDLLQPFYEPKNTRRKRSFDILNYIFGKTAHEGEPNDQPEFQKSLQPRFSNYFKLFGSEIYFDKLDMEDLQKIFLDALFGDGTATRAGITFSKTSINVRHSLTKAHLLAEGHYIVPTLIGIPVKISSKVAAVVKGNLECNITGAPQLITAQFKKYKASVEAQPNIAIHMHHKAGICLPIFETGIIVKNHVLAAPRIHAVVTLKPKSFKVRFPTDQADQQILDMRSRAHAITREELTPGVRNWHDIDLGLSMRGMTKIRRTCYGNKYFGLEACVEGRTADKAYVRTRRLPAFPYQFLNDLNCALKRGDDAPAQVLLKHVILANNKKMYKARGEIDLSGKVKRKLIFESKCDVTKMTCNAGWTIKHRMCDQPCTAQTDLDASSPNKVAIRHKYGGNSMNCDITIEEEGKLMRMVSSWDKLPERFRRLLRYYHPRIVAFLSQYFGIEGVESKGKQCEVRVRLHDKFTADIFVDAPNLKLRRINQELPFELEKFPTCGIEIKAMLKSHYGTCQVKGDDYIKTTDNVSIREQFPGTCPFVLAQDARSEQPEWRILLKHNARGQKNVIVVIKGKRIRLCQDMTLMVNRQKVALQNEFKMPGVRVKRTADNKLFLQAEAGFQCLFDGSNVVVLFMPWWYNRIRGICGNYDGEQWTDLMTSAKTYVPEKMKMEFLRAWVVEGKDCQESKQCKLRTRHIKLNQGAPAGQVCFTNGKFLRCLKKCRPLKTRAVTVAHHCVPANSPLIEKITQEQKTVDLLNRSVDTMATVHEHLTCQCACT